MGYFVYAIKSVGRNYTYVGMTDNIQRRLSEHNSGRVRSTKHYAPFELVYLEEQPDRLAARTREKYFKSGYGRGLLKGKN